MLFKKMADDQCRAAKEAMRKHQTKIKDAILAAGLVDVLDEFETNGFITEGVKLDLKDDRTGKSEGDRASSLVDKIRRSSFTYYPDETMKRFLKILEKKCGLPGEGVVKEIRKDYPYLSQQSNNGQKTEIQEPSSSSNGQPSQPNPVDNVEQDWGWPGRRNESIVYEYPRSKGGMVAIIANENWIGKPECKREGTDTDVKRIQDTFGELGFQVLPVKKDLKAAGMDEYFKNFTKGFESEMVEVPDVFVCFILSHGNQDGIEGVDGEHVQLRDLAKHLESDKCPALKGKPKLFFVQACRGQGQPDQVQLDHTHLPGEDRIVMDGNISAIPPGADFLFGYSTVRDNASLRKTISGSFYIQILCDAIDQYHKKLSLNDIMMYIHQQLATGDQYKYEFKGKTYRQMAEMVTTLRGNVYFHK